MIEGGATGIGWTRAGGGVGWGFDTGWREGGCDCFAEGAGWAGVGAITVNAKDCLIV